MALIAKEPPVEKKEQLNIRIDPTVGEMLRSYCEFIDSSHYAEFRTMPSNLNTSSQGP